MFSVLNLILNVLLQIKIVATVYVSESVAEGVFVAFLHKSAMFKKSKFIFRHLCAWIHSRITF